MPSVLIEVRRSYNPTEVEALIEAVHSALRTAFQILPNDRNVRLLVHDAHRFACPPGCHQPERYTHVTIDAIAGRSLDAKRALYREIVENLERLDIPRDHVKIVLRDIPRSNWGIRGGQAACDVDLGFDVEV
jgi:phenylpyruvate tautomerase PptA (4-oxalocrotonate tautomerase family)